MLRRAPKRRAVTLFRMLETTPVAAEPDSAHRTITPSVLYFGTPVGVLSTVNADGTSNLAPISSYWALDDLLVIGLGATGHSIANLRRTPELVLNLVDEGRWEPVELLGRATGADPIPEGKREGTRFVADKFSMVGWHPLRSGIVAPDRVAELPVHLEARVTGIHEEPDGVASVHARVCAVHVADELTVPGTSHVNPERWRPLIYNFRHYYGLGDRRGIAGIAEVQ